MEGGLLIQRSSIRGLLIRANTSSRTWTSVHHVVTGTWQVRGAKWPISIGSLYPSGEEIRYVTCLFSVSSSDGQMSSAPR